MAKATLPKMWRCSCINMMDHTRRPARTCNKLECSGCSRCCACQRVSVMLQRRRAANSGDQQHYLCEDFPAEPERSTKTASKHTRQSGSISLYNCCASYISISSSVMPGCVHTCLKVWGGVKAATAGCEKKIQSTGD